MPYWKLNSDVEICGVLHFRKVSGQWGWSTFHDLDGLLKHPRAFPTRFFWNIQPIFQYSLWSWTLWQPPWMHVSWSGGLGLPGSHPCYSGPSRPVVLRGARKVGAKFGGVTRLGGGVQMTPHPDSRIGG